VLMRRMVPVHVRACLAEAVRRRVPVGIGVDGHRVRQL